MKSVQVPTRGEGGSEIGDFTAYVLYGCPLIEITLRSGYSPVNLLHIFRTHFYMNTYGGLLLHGYYGLFEFLENFVTL